MPPRSKFEEEEEHSEHVHDESNWLVSYADLMTLLFGFFVLMYSFSKIDDQKFKVVRKELVQYFGGQYTENIAPTQTKDLKKKIESLVNQGGLSEFIDVTTTNHSMSLRFDGEILFRSGSARLVSEMAPVLTEIVALMKKQKGIKQIEVEGHTDDDPIYSPVFPTNWELSSARATRIVRQFEAEGFPSDLLVAKGFGASRPIAANRDKKGQPIEKNQARNRRVIITLDYAADPILARELIESNRFKSNAATDPVSQPDIQPALEKDEVGEGEQKSQEEILAERMKKAQERLKKLQTKKREEQKLRRMKKKVSEMEKKVKTLEREVGSPGGVKRDSASKDAPEVMSREKGLKKLRQNADQK